MSGTDPYWNHVGAALHLDTEPATEVKGKTVIATGTAASITEDSSQTLFGNHTLHFVGESNDASGTAGSTLRIVSSADWNFGSGDFTIEGWALYAGGLLMADTVDVMIPYPLMERSNGTFNSGCWSLHNAVYRRLEGGVQVRRPQFEFWHRDYSGSAPMLQADQASTAASEGNWRHFAVTRQGNEWTLWLQGVSVATRTYATDTGTPSADLRIGNSIFNTDSSGIDVSAAPKQGRAFSGNLAECRITKGWARYTVDFSAAIAGGTAPGARFPDTLDDGDYSGPTYTGATGPAATVPGPAGVPGQPGADGRVPRALVLPPPPPQYDARNEADVRRAVMAALRDSS